MELGFNLSNHKIEEMNNYEVLTAYFDFEEDYLNVNLNQGADNLESLFKSIISRIEEDKNYSIILKISNEEELTYEEYFTIFSMFTFLLAEEGKINDRGYLTVKEEIANKIVSTEYSLLKIMNHNYNYGIIQLIVEDEKGYVSKWVN